MDIEEYLDYLRVYEKDGVAHTNDERGISRKLASLRSFYNYYFCKEMITKNPAQLVRMPKKHEKTWIPVPKSNVIIARSRHLVCS